MKGSMHTYTYMHYRDYPVQRGETDPSLILTPWPGTQARILNELAQSMANRTLWCDIVSAISTAVN